jgi:hypothetical protein
MTVLIAKRSVHTVGARGSDRDRLRTQEMRTESWRRWNLVRPPRWEVQLHLTRQRMRGDDRCHTACPDNRINCRAIRCTAPTMTMCKTIELTRRNAPETSFGRLIY